VASSADPGTSPREEAGIALLSFPKGSMNRHETESKKKGKGKKTETLKNFHPEQPTGKDS